MTNLLDKIEKYINLKTPNFKVDVMEVTTQDYDGEEGCINENYIVKCVVKDFEINTEKTCLVNISQFKRWLNEEESIKWI